MLIDDVTIKVTAGHGGKGAVAFQKNLLSLGPTGGKGGNGGSVYALGVADIGALAHFRHEKTVRAENGKAGRKQLNDGTAGEDVIVRLPIGTVIHNLTRGDECEITHVGERVPLAKGGWGGKGNYAFRSAINTTPKEFQPGLPGESFSLRLELKLIADVGFIGLPNVGKSSLLNALTRAQSKVANYRFTTLEPNLGAYYDLILADLPGLIEGASTGKGLGYKFLRHIERTRSLFHIIAADSSDPPKDYQDIRKELRAYSEVLSEKDEWIFVNKTDLVSPEVAEGIVKKLRKKNDRVTLLSLETAVGLDEVRNVLNTITSKKHIVAS